MNNLPENIWTSLTVLHKDLLVAKEVLYNKCGFDCTFPRVEAESSDYAAYTFKINGLFIKYRAAKITPTKIGQFVTLWKRDGKGPIQPFDISDNIDLFIISTRNDNYFGQFIFPKTVLLEKGIISGSNNEGKRAIRVYPPWDNATNKQAQKTQQWQLEYFLEIVQDKPTDLVRAKRLFQR
ncbi:MAG: MepB family protein [Bacillus sp. (in: Bacteria)]|nr:MepB family protein [Bacillus sp. (in: firmicutes)]